MAPAETEDIGQTASLGTGENNRQLKRINLLRAEQQKSWAEARPGL